jgi:hypothetical protein
MTQSRERTPIDATDSDSGAALLDLAPIVHLVGFARRSMRRHVLLSAGSFVLVVGMAVVALLVMPKSYFTESKILAQRNMVMPALGNPRRAVPPESDAPTKLATEAVMKRDNLLAIIRQTNLLAEWKGQRVAVVRMKDALVSRLRRPLTAEEELDALVGLLGHRLFVDPKEGTVTIGVTWPDARTAYHIVQAAQDNFLTERHSTEVSLIGESIAILEGHVATTRLDIDSAYSELQRVTPSTARQTTVRAPRLNQALASQQALYSAKQQAIADITSFQARRVAELQARLAEQARVLGANHPEIAETRRGLAAASVEPPQLGALRQELEQLAGRIIAQGGVPGVAVQPAALNEQVIAAARGIRPDSASSAEESYARSRLKIALDNYQDLLDRLNSARIELQTARAAFKYRYSVLTPGQIPSKPTKPNPPLLLGLGVMLGACLAVAAPLLLDLLRGRVLEPWQVRSSLGLEVLGEVGSA